MISNDHILRPDDKLSNGHLDAVVKMVWQRTAKIQLIPRTDRRRKTTVTLAIADVHKNFDLKKTA